jgi:hypothetical protein
MNPKQPSIDPHYVAKLEETVANLREQNSNMIILNLDLDARLKQARGWACLWKQVAKRRGEEDLIEPGNAPGQPAPPPPLPTEEPTAKLLDLASRYRGDGDRHNQWAEGYDRGMAVAFETAAQLIRELGD